ncbi:hypothetical protein MMC30_002241 [Trapelia coarctata]|nr:hypothetical protein [Trapelia coarctata]
MSIQGAYLQGWFGFWSPLGNLRTSVLFDFCLSSGSDRRKAATFIGTVELTEEYQLTTCYPRSGPIYLFCAPEVLNAFLEAVDSLPAAHQIPPEDGEEFPTKEEAKERIQDWGFWRKARKEQTKKEKQAMKAAKIAERQRKTEAKAQKHAAKKAERTETANRRKTALTAAQKELRKKKFAGKKTDVS